MPHRYPKPLGTHVKAIVAALAPMAFSVLFSWLFPLSVFSLTRENAERVDAVVNQRLLYVIPLSHRAMADVQTITTHEEESGRGNDHVRGMTLYFVKFVDRQGNEMLAAANEATVDALTGRLSAFLEGEDPTLSVWTMPFFGWAAALPAAVSCMLLALVLPDAGRSLWAWVRQPQPAATG